MTPFHYRDEDTSVGSIVTGLTIGALAGFAVGVIFAQKVGGISGIASRIRERVRGGDEEDLAGRHG